MKKILHDEEVFHDHWADNINIDDLLVDESFEACTCPENRYIIRKLGKIKNKKILDVGCGAGESSVYFAKNGAIVTACDLSMGMLNVVKKLAKKNKVKVKTTQCYSHKTPFESDSFDIVYTANLLHHVVAESTLKEVIRILKPGGIFVSWDPLSHNILINIYRQMATNVRTKDEHPIRFEQLKILNKYFSKIEINTTWFFTMWIFIRFFLFDRIHPNKERYWKKIVKDHKKLYKTYTTLEKIDKSFLTLFPFMKKYCWNVIIYAVKK